MDLKAKKILVTGGAGLIGSHLVDKLVSIGAEVTILDNLDPQTHPFGKPDWINKEAKFIKGDVRNLEDWEKALDGVEYVFHQAAFGGFTPELSTYVDSNAKGTTLMFEAIIKNNLPIKKIVAASSQAVYGEGTYRNSKGELYYPRFLRDHSELERGAWSIQKDGENLIPIPTNEDKPLFTETIYGISKLAEEKLTIGLGRKFGIPSVALRYAVTFGPRQSIFNPYTGVVSIFSTQILNDVKPVVYEDGNQSRDYIYVSDNVEANILVMSDKRADYQVYNVGSGIPVKISSLAKELSKAYGRSEEINLTGEFRPQDVRDFIHDSTKLKKLGFNPEVSLSSGIEKYVEWIKSQGEVEEYFSKAREKMKTSGIVFQSKK